MRSAPERRTNYVVLFQGRAGSSYLMDALGRLPHVIAEGEMLVDIEPPAESLRQRIRRLVYAEMDEAALQLRSTRDFFAASWDGARAVGFKTKVQDVRDLDGFARLLSDLHVRVVALERRNLVKQAVSLLNGARLHAERGDWNLRAGQPRLGPFAVDAATFDDTLRQVADAHDALDAFVAPLAAPVLRLAYEELLRDRNAWFARVCGFLGLPPAEPRSELGKNTEDDLRSVLLNFDELRSRYRGSPYAAMFDDAVPASR